MKVLVVGSGGREHALVWKILQSPLVDKVFCAPGNAGTAAVAENVALPAAMSEAVDFIAEFVTLHAVDLTVVGPEAFLAAGLTNRLRALGAAVFGPSAEAARVETSKAFAKGLMMRAGIPTAGYGEFTDLTEAVRHIEGRTPPLVVKADGLAAGKGVVVANTRAEAIAAVEGMLCEGRFGAAGHRVIIEDFLDGEEASVLAITDGREVLTLPPAQDHKRAGEGDTGPNTGGMGAYAPAPLVTPELLVEVRKRILLPLLRQIELEGCSFRGLLYAGLMVTDRGPMVVEFNARFGDPETQVILPLIESDLVPVLLAAAQGDLSATGLRLASGAAATVVIAASGYPGEYRGGEEIRGLERAERIEGVAVFHAGTKAVGGRTLSAGGRVLNVTARGADIRQALERAYQGVEAIDYPGGYCRRDIGYRVLGRRSSEREESTSLSTGSPGATTTDR